MYPRVFFYFFYVKTLHSICTETYEDEHAIIIFK